ncbi:MAG: adenylate/guanylate cyclase domain-containing protein [Nitrospirae bacterium]|nr:MAG: adenylate/guanylate cyclase domain-containing protein [Nitrospirota bacterium]
MKQAYKVLALAGLSLLLSYLFVQTTILRSFEQKAFDQFSRHFNPDTAPDDIILVAVDQQSIDGLAKELVYWPWPRQVYAPLVEHLSKADAVFIDILFTEPSASGHQDDLIFSGALKTAGNVYLPVFLTADRRPLDQAETAFLHAIAAPAGTRGFGGFHSAVLPIDTLRLAAKGAGNVTMRPDEDGVYRRVPLFFGLGELVIPNFIVSDLLREKVVTIRDGLPAAGGSMVPLADDMLLLRFSNKPFRTIPAVDIIRSYLDSRGAGTARYPEEFFKGKKVFIGLTAAGLYDLKPTAVSAVSTGVEVHATAIENLLHRNFIRPLPALYSFLFSLLLCMAACHVVITYHRIGINLAAFMLLFSASVLVPALLFSNAYYMQIILPAFMLSVGFTLSAVYSYATEGRQRRFIKRTFSQYMDRQLVEYVLRNPEVIKPGGQRQHATVFFADIAGFTTMAEKVPPEDVAKLLHSVLNAFTEVIIEHGGVIDKYIGDCVMAFWGAPVRTAQDEAHACSAAINCINSLVRINEAFRADGLPEIAVRIGIHSGDVIVGNLGSDRLFDYTVVGDTVNTASRLESVNKVFQTKIIISGETLQRTSGEFLTRELGLIEVKGRSKPIRIFELIGRQDHTETQQTLPLFHAGLEAFRERRWQDAFARFNEVLERRPDDGPALFYRERTGQILSDPSLTDDFDIIKMKDK